MTIQMFSFWRHDILHYGIQQNDIGQNDKEWLSTEWHKAGQDSIINGENITGEY